MAEVLFTALLCACNSNSANPNNDSSSQTQQQDLARPSVYVSQAEQRYFMDNDLLYQDISSLPTAASSMAILQWLEGQPAPYGWISGSTKFDFSFSVVDASYATMRRDFIREDAFFRTPDCDLVNIPVPPYGAVRETPGFMADLSGPFTGYNCFGFSAGADCHMLILARNERRLYEIYHATIDTVGEFHAGCVAVWHLDAFSHMDRGLDCVGSDISGVPISPTLLSPDEVVANKIGHVLRLSLPSRLILPKGYVQPATHGIPAGGPSMAPPMGIRLRLKASYLLDGLPASARTVASALKKFGMVLGGQGSLAISAQSDALSLAKWNKAELDALAALKATDFEVVDYGTVTNGAGACNRVQITQ